MVLLSSACGLLFLAPVDAEAILTTMESSSSINGTLSNHTSLSRSIPVSTEEVASNFSVDIDSINATLLQDEKLEYSSGNASVSQEDTPASNNNETAQEDTSETKDFTAQEVQATLSEEDADDGVELNEQQSSVNNGGADTMRGKVHSESHPLSEELQDDIDLDTIVETDVVTSTAEPIIHDGDDHIDQYPHSDHTSRQKDNIHSPRSEKPFDDIAPKESSEEATSDQESMGKLTTQTPKIPENNQGDNSVSSLDAELLEKDDHDSLPVLTDELESVPISEHDVRDQEATSTGANENPNDHQGGQEDMEGEPTPVNIQDLKVQLKEELGEGPLKIEPLRREAEADTVPPTVQASSTTDDGADEESREASKDSPPGGSLADFFDKLNSKEAKKYGFSDSIPPSSFERLAANQEKVNAADQERENLETDDVGVTAEPYSGGLPWGLVYEKKRHIPDTELLYLFFKDRMNADANFHNRPNAEAVFPLSMGQHDDDASATTEGFSNGPEHIDELMQASQRATEKSMDTAPSTDGGKSQNDSSDDVDENLASSPVEDRDGLRGLFEGVDPPDELDVGAASGSSMQEFLMGKGKEILLRRVSLGIKFIQGIVASAKVKIEERLERGKLQRKESILHDDQESGPTKDRRKALAFLTDQDWKQLLATGLRSARMAAQTMARFVNGLIHDEDEEETMDRIGEDLDLDSIRKLSGL